MPMQEGGLYEFEFYFTVKEDDSDLDMTDFDLAMEWYSDKCTSPIVLTPGSGLTLSNVEGGRFVVTLSPSQTQSLGAGVARCILYQDYNNPERKSWLGEGDEVCEGKRFNA